MHVVSLRLGDFRNYSAASVTFSPGANVFVGANGQGKTNLLEAVYYSAALRSHRVASDAPLVREGRDQATVRIAVQRRERRAELELSIIPGRGTRARLNGVALSRAREALGLLRAVVFAPEDLSLVKGEPSARRAMLDELLVQRQPRWAGVIADLDRVLRQRGALLRAVAKRGGRPDAADVSTLAVWDEQLSRLGGEVWRARLELVGALRAPFAESYQALAQDSARPWLDYRSSVTADRVEDLASLRSILARALESRRVEEFRRGVNLVGPQRDDLEIALHGRPAKGYASHGESWSLALALRLAAYRLLASESVDGGDPVLLLDDVFAELDAARRDRLADLVAGAEQVIVTAAVGADVPQRFAGKRFTVAAGTVGLRESA